MKLLIRLVVLLLCTLSVHAQDIPAPMSPPQLVNDFTQTFSPEQKNDLEQMLRAYNDSTSTQIYVVTVADLQGYAPSDYAARMGQAWGIGQKDKNNGVLILIKPRIGNQRGQVFIATGYGVEPILTDARCGRIIDNYMMPYLQNGDYYGASKAAAETIIQYLSGEFKADKEPAPLPSGFYIALFVIVGALIYSFIKGGNHNDSSGGSSGGGGKMFFPPIFGGGRSSGGWGGGGSFGGGGGGSFGGGGAGRSF